jgi:hypothetical protein
MRIIGGRDYYDGMAFPSDGTVLSMIVYRRTGTPLDDRTMRRLIPHGTAIPSILLSNMSQRPSMAQRFAARIRKAFRPSGPLARLDGGDITIRLDHGAALFCGTLRRCVLVTARSAWSSNRTRTSRDWCWTVEALEEALASYGARMETQGLAEWFAPVDVSDGARAAGIAVATLDPIDRTAGDPTWRLECPTLCAMNHQQVLSPSDALRQLAVWLGGESARTVVRVRAEQGVDRDGVALLSA